jgi:hypothetical protein
MKTSVLPSTHIPKALWMLMLACMLLSLGTLVFQIQSWKALERPRLVLQTPGSLTFPVQSKPLSWTPEVACDFIKLFLPVLYSFSPEGHELGERWEPFIAESLIRFYSDRFKLNRNIIQLDGLLQYLTIQKVEFHPETASAMVTAELHIINRLGDLTRSPMNLQVRLVRTSDTSNPYGYRIESVEGLDELPAKRQIY